MFPRSFTNILKKNNVEVTAQAPPPNLLYTNLSSHKHTHTHQKGHIYSQGREGGTSNHQLINILNETMCEMLGQWRREKTVPLSMLP